MTLSRTPEAVSLFTGAGGLDVGLERAGFRTVAAVDFDRDCTLTLRANQELRLPVAGSGRSFLQGAKIIHADVASLSPDDLRPQYRSEGWTPDLLVGGPPCQPFSSSGRMLSVDDPRGRLFEHFARLASQLKPRFILFENVRGLVTASGQSGEPGGALLEVKSAFEAIGYATRFALLNAADFGAPQRRVRLFMIGSRSGPLPEFPAETHSRDGGPTLFGDTLPWLTLGEFLAGRPDPSECDVVRPTLDLAGQLAEIPDGSGIKSPGFREATRPGGHWGYKQGTFIADLRKPARTVTTSTQDWIRLADGSLRRLTWNEAAALQGFPTKWVFIGNAASRLRQIGNAVPAVFGVAIGARLVSGCRSAESPRPQSASLPSNFIDAIEYTRRERHRNGASRREGAQAIREKRADVFVVKGLGKAERAGAAS